MPLPTPMHFTTLSGITHHFNPTQWQLPTDYRANIVGEEPEAYLLEDTLGHRALFPKALVDANWLDVADNRIGLSKTLYRHYFATLLQQRNEAAFKQLRQQFASVVECHELVLSRPEYFLIRNDRFGGGETISGGFNVCLGGLLEAWFVTKSLWLEREGCPSGYYMVSIGGSRLSGQHLAVLWSPDLQQFISVSDLVNWSQWLEKFKAISLRYPAELSIDLQYRAVEMLLKDAAKLDAKH